MVLMETPKVNLGWKAPDFKLKGTDGKDYSLKDVCGENGLVVMFISNHCPYVKAIQDKLVRDIEELQAGSIGCVAICANDPAAYPEDDFLHMQQVAEDKSYPFPYLQDETQEVARAYDAVCTPDFYGFDKNLTLQYRGRLDSSGREDVLGNDLELVRAMKQVAQTGKAPNIQHPSIGCSIKWK